MRRLFCVSFCGASEASAKNSAANAKSRLNMPSNLIGLVGLRLHQLQLHQLDERQLAQREVPARGVRRPGLARFAPRRSANSGLSVSSNQRARLGEVEIFPWAVGKTLYGARRKPKREAGSRSGRGKKMEEDIPHLEPLFRHQRPSASARPPDPPCRAVAPGF